MPYSTTWSNDRPTGAEAAKNIDNEIRLLRAQISERMNGSLVVDWAADPIVPINTAGAGLNRVMIIPFPSFIPHVPSENPAHQNDHILAAYSTTLNASLILPQYSHIKGVEFLVDRNTCTSLNCGLVEIAFTPSLTAAVPIALTTSAAGFTDVISAPVDIEIDGFKFYYLQVTAIGSGANTYKVAGARILYTS